MAWDQAMACVTALRIQLSSLSTPRDQPNVGCSHASKSLPVRRKTGTGLSLMIGEPQKCERDVTIAREMDIYLEVSLRHGAHRRRFGPFPCHSASR